MLLTSALMLLAVDIYGKGLDHRRRACTRARARASKAWRRCRRDRRALRRRHPRDPPPFAPAQGAVQRRHVRGRRGCRIRGIPPLPPLELDARGARARARSGATACLAGQHRDPLTLVRAFRRAAVAFPRRSNDRLRWLMFLHHPRGLSGLVQRRFRVPELRPVGLLAFSPAACPAGTAQQHQQLNKTRSAVADAEPRDHAELRRC